MLTLCDFLESVTRLIARSPVFNDLSATRTLAWSIYLYSWVVYLPVAPHMSIPALSDTDYAEIAPGILLQLSESPAQSNGERY